MYSANSASGGGGSAGERGDIVLKGWQYTLLKNGRTKFGFFATGLATQTVATKAQKCNPAGEVRISGPSRAPVAMNGLFELPGAGTFFSLSLLIYNLRATMMATKVEPMSFGKGSTPAMFERKVATRRYEKRATKTK